MHLHWSSIKRAAPLAFLIWIAIVAVEGKKKGPPVCPVGFMLAATKHKGDPICYRRKGPELFTDAFDDCTGNIYSSSLYNSLNITDPSTTLWTEFRSLYPGGPFIDWSYSNSIGDLLMSTYDVNYNPDLGLDENLCVVIDPVSNFTATKCDEKHYRYCFVKPYPDEEDMTDKGCDSLRESWRFSGPLSTCLTVLNGVGGGPVRATWKQAQDLCSIRGGSILNQGWIYANNPMFRATGFNRTYPFGIIMSSDNFLLRYDSEDDHSEIPEASWNFKESVQSEKGLLGALHDNFWYLVNGSYIFYDVICEKSILKKNITLNVTIDFDNKLTLYVNDTLGESDVHCFSDSVIHYPTRIKVYRDDKNLFVLKPITDGYYWCVHTDTQNYHLTESNKVLFIREKVSVINVYATRIRLKKRYNFENLEKMYRLWIKKLREYVFYRTKHTQIYGEGPLLSKDTEKILKQFKSSTPGLDWKEKEIIHNSKIKRLYLDGRTALLHVELNAEMLPVPPGWWDDVEVEYMKPVYYCRGFDSVPTLKLGESVPSFGCRTHQCVGDFNEGVQWVTTATDGCIMKPPVLAFTTVRIQERRIQDMSVTQHMPTYFGDSTESTTRVDAPQIMDASDESSEESTERYKPKPTPPSTTPDPHEIVPTTTDVVTTVTMTTTEVPEPTTTVQPTMRPPEEQLQQVLEDLEQLVNNGSVPIMVENIEDVFDQVDVLLDMESDLDIPGQMLHLLDKLGSTVNLNGSGSAAAVRGNVALVMADAKPENPVRGLRIAANDIGTFTKDSFELLSAEPNSSSLSSAASEAVVSLPASVTETSRRISFVAFRNDRAFAGGRPGYAINSRVLSVNVEDVTQFASGEVVDIHISPITSDPYRNQSRACAYWHFLEDGTGFWSQDGCTLIRSEEPDLLDTCRCDHLTHFAEVLVPAAVFSEKDESALEIISIVGCCVSIVGLCLVAVTAATFRSWRRSYSNKIWLHLCAAVLLLVVCFLAVPLVKFQTNSVGCMLLGVLLHYAVLASFAWMVIAAVLSYRRLVLVFTRDASHKLLRAAAFAWGAPCAIVGVLLAAAPDSYAGRFETKTPTGTFCYPSGLGLWLAVYAPAAVALLTNWVLFALIIRSVFTSSRVRRHGDAHEALRCASVSCLLVFLFGLPWIFGLFAFNLIAAYLFTLTASYQGFVLFIFFVVGNKKTRDMWLDKLKIRQTRKVPVTSSTYSNRSTNAGWRAAEQKAAKPRSLATPDDSRFS